MNKYERTPTGFVKVKREQDLIITGSRVERVTRHGERILVCLDTEDTCSWVSKFRGQYVSESRLPANSSSDEAGKHQLLFSVDDILNGKTSFNDDKDKSGNWIGLPNALEEALHYAGPRGIVVTMPELIAAKVKADKKTHLFWQEWYTVHTEENIGIDTKGRFYKRNEPVLVVVNGGGILTPARIRQAYTEGLIYHSAWYKDKEFDDLLEGKTADGSRIKLYRFEDIKKGVPNLPHRFGVVMPYLLAQETSSGYHKKDGFLKNPLVIARAGGSENLEAYFEKAKDSDGDISNHHPFSGQDPSTPQGRLLFLDNASSGLNGNINLSLYGRFVWVRKK